MALGLFLDDGAPLLQTPLLFSIRIRALLERRLFSSRG